MTITIEKVTKEYKKALKNADTVCFRLLESGQSQLEIYKKLNIDGFESESRMTIKVGTKTDIYEGGIGANYKYEIEKAFSSIHYSYDDLKWQTVVNFLKNDDEIYLEWIAGNNSNILDENNLSSDIISVKVKRNDKFVGLFQMDDSVTHKQSLARMIKLRKKM